MIVDLVTTILPVQFPARVYWPSLSQSTISKLSSNTLPIRVTNHTAVLSSTYPQIVTEVVDSESNNVG